MTLKEYRLIRDIFTSKSSSLRKLDALRAELELIARRCHELESRHQAPSLIAPASDYSPKESAEIRFAACIASGMSKAKESGRTS